MTKLDLETAEAALDGGYLFVRAVFSSDIFRLTRDGETRRKLTRPGDYAIPVRSGRFRGRITHDREYTCEGHNIIVEATL